MPTAAKVLLGLTVAVIVAAGVYYVAFVPKNAPTNPPAQNGNATTTPPLGDGADDEDDIVEDDLIRITSPKPNELIANPITVAGEARGNWYFEASFPAELLDGNGKRIATVPVQAQGNWMTTDFVPFKTMFSFTPPTTATGTLVLHKDNPSGLPEHDDERRIPIVFSQAQRDVTLYYYNPKLDKDVKGNIQCSSQGLVAVNRTIPSTLTPVQDVIRLLLQGELTEREKQGGITTEFPLVDVELKGAALRDGTLTLEFADPQHKTSGGSCHATLLWAQIEATAKQFPEVQNVRFIPEELFQP
jgi:hypothetical protein